MKTVRQLLAIFLVLAMLGANDVVVAYPQDRSGSCGENVRWSYNGSTYSLSIFGIGPMENYKSEFYVPWRSVQGYITSVSIGNGVTSIGDHTFDCCNGLTNITIPNSVTSIGDFAFKDCTNLTNVTIPNSVTSIGDGTFQNCTNLTNVTIPNSVTSIGSLDRYGYDCGAFEGCINLTNVTIPNSVTIIGKAAFMDCTNLTNITIPNSVTSIGDSAFEDCTGLTTITIPNSVTSIGLWAFDECTGLTNITIPDSLTSIGQGIFGGCTGLTNITIPNSVTSIDSGAFCGCTGLTNITIPSSVTSIGDYAFMNCAGLTDVSVHNAEAVFNKGVFAGCTLNLHGHIGSTSDAYASGESGITFVPFKTEMTPPDFVLPEALTHIEVEAFSGAKMTVVYIPDRVSFLGNKAFAYCNNLTEIRIPASVKTIPPDLFYGLTSTQLARITIFGTPGSAAEVFANSKGMMFEVE